jgi:carboxypeptidase Taq
MSESDDRVGESADSERSAAVETVRETGRRYTLLGDVGGVLQWDQEVTMPEGGTPARAQQSSALSGTRHDILTEAAVGEALSAVDRDALSDTDRAIDREIRREYERAERVPTDLVEELSETTAEAHPIWKEAKEEADFDAFAPTLRDLVRLSRERAEHIDPEADPYAVLFADYEPYLDLETAEDVLTDLRDGLVPLLESVAESEVTAPTVFEGTYDESTQEALVWDALDWLGYDWEHGRLDTAPHPFSTGTPFDARVTTRFDEEDPLAGLTSTIHEFGHATYTQGLPREHYGTPLAQSRDLTVHESQSRLWENHVGRSEPFWEGFWPTVVEHCPSLAGTDPAAAYAAANEVYPDNPIRVEADELTYHLHIVVRFEIERDLVRGDLDVEEIPAVWNDRYEALLGVRPADDAEGCLQDIHWSHGSFGYFPTYSLGSVLAAQLDRQVREAIDDLDGQIRAGEFGPLTEFLGEEIHQHGRRYTTEDLIERATGESLSAEPFLEYVGEKYASLYDCR